MLAVGLFVKDDSLLDITNGKSGLFRGMEKITPDYKKKFIGFMKIIPILLIFCTPLS